MTNPQSNPKRKDFDYVIANAPKELSRVHTKQEGRNHYGLFSFVNEAGDRKFVEASADDLANVEVSVDDLENVEGSG